MSKTYTVKCENCHGTGKVDITFLRRQRLSLGLDQEDVALAVGVSRAQLSNIERGESGIASDKLLAYSEVMKLPVESILRELYGDTL